MNSRLDLIDLDQELPGQRLFISCWVAQTEGAVFIVDPGPPATADFLISRLEELGVSQLDYILLTHIHLDHGGATAQILDRWPTARVVCHKVGRKHLIDPARLWEGSLQVLGHKAEVYGEPRPVPAASLAQDFAEKASGIQTIPTPGHAPHHVAYLHEGNLFVGESAGTFSSLDGEAGLTTADRDPDDYYLRPATPPRFFLPVATGSLDRLRALNPVPERICFAHHGQFTGDVSGLLVEAQTQLALWVDTVAKVVQQEARGVVPPPGPEYEALFPLISDVLQSADPRFARGERLAADIRERERDFTRQTMRGMLGYLASLD